MKRTLIFIFVLFYFTRYTIASQQAIVEEQAKRETKNVFFLIIKLLLIVLSFNLFYAFSQAAYSIYIKYIYISRLHMKPPLADD
jgi:hypothetical protein